MFGFKYNFILYFSPDSSNEMFGKDEALLCVRGGWTSNSDECPQRQKPLISRGKGDQRIKQAFRGHFKRREGLLRGWEYTTLK